MGNDLIITEKEYKLKKEVTVKELEDGWLLIVVSKASGIKYGDLLKLKGKDFLTILNKTSFFLNTGLDLEEDTENTGTEETKYLRKKPWQKNRGNTASGCRYS